MILSVVVPWSLLLWYNMAVIRWRPSTVVVPWSLLLWYNWLCQSIRWTWVVVPWSLLLWYNSGKIPPAPLNVVVPWSLLLWYNRLHRDPQIASKPCAFSRDFARISRKNMCFPKMKRMFFLLFSFSFSNVVSIFRTASAAPFAAVHHTPSAFPVRSEYCCTVFL